MRLIAGLGNPGEKYRETRHNAGFLFLDALTETQKLRWSVTRGKYAVAGPLRGTDTLLLKPLTYMNLSGDAIAHVTAANAIAPADVLVIYDDVHLPLLTYKVKAGGGSGGHNGIASVTGSLGTDRYPRLRLGVGDGPATGSGLVDFVLGAFSQSELRQCLSFFQSLFPLVLAFAAGGTAEMLNLHSRLAAGSAPPEKADAVS